jgi:ribosome-associated toxin RatA of RatAB toxin-antitoxin module
MIRKVITLFFIFFVFSNICYADIKDIVLKPEEKKLIEQGEILVRELPTSYKQGRTFKAIGLINAEVSHIYKVLKDFESYPEFMPNLDKIEVLKRESNSAVLNYTLDLPLNKVKKYRLSNNFKQEKNSAVITWELIPWPGLQEAEKIKDTKGYWNLRNYQDKKGYVLAVYHVYTDPGPIPTGLGWIVNILTQDSVPKVMLNTRKRVQELYH